MPVADADAARRFAWLPLTAAVVLRVVVGLALLTCAWQSISSAYYFEATDEALFEAQVGASLRPAAIIGGLLFVAGALLSRRRWWGRGVANALDVTSSVAVAAVVIPALVVAHGRLHPGFETERAALHAFDAPTPGSPHLDFEIAAHPTMTATWTVEGNERVVCRAADAVFGAWADAGSDRTAARSPSAYDRVARRGIDAATLTCVAAPAPGSPVYLILTLTRTS